MITPDTSVNLSRKNNPWGKIVGDMSVDEEGVLTYKGNPVNTTAGPCLVPGDMNKATIG